MRPPSGRSSTLSNTAGNIIVKLLGWGYATSKDLWADVTRSDLLVGVLLEVVCIRICSWKVLRGCRTVFPKNKRHHHWNTILNAIYTLSPPLSSILPMQSKTKKFPLKSVDMYMGNILTSKGCFRWFMQTCGLTIKGNGLFWKTTATLRSLLTCFSSIIFMVAAV